MPLNKTNTRTFHRTLYAGILEKVTLLKREDDLRQGTVTSYTVYQIRWSRVYKSGEPFQGDMHSDHRRTIHIPRVELDRIGVAYINPADRFVDEQNRIWQPESTTQIVIPLFSNHICVDCLRADNPA